MHPQLRRRRLQIIDGKARIIDDYYCDGLGACLGHCPLNAITIIERKAPEFDDVNHYIEKLGEMLKVNEVRSLTVVHMEVPCCSALNVVSRRALDVSGRMIQTQRLIVSVGGDIKRA